MEKRVVFPQLRPLTIAASRRALLANLGGRVGFTSPDQATAFVASENEFVFTTFVAS